MEYQSPRSPDTCTNDQVGDRARRYTPHQRGVLTIGHDARPGREATPTATHSSALWTPFRLGCTSSSNTASPPSAGLFAFGHNSAEGSGTAAPLSRGLLTFGERATQLSGWDKGDQPRSGEGSSITAISNRNSPALSTAPTTNPIDKYVTTMDVEDTGAQTAENIFGQHASSSIRSSYEHNHDGFKNRESSPALLVSALSTRGGATIDAGLVFPAPTGDRHTVALAVGKNDGPSTPALTKGNASTTQEFSDAAAQSAPRETKLCSVCSAWKPRDQWHKKEWKKNGRCIACVTSENLKQARQRAEKRKAAKAAKKDALQCTQKKPKDEKKEGQARKRNVEKKDVEEQKLATASVTKQEVAQRQAFEPQARPPWPMALQGASNEHARPEVSVPLAPKWLGLTRAAASVTEKQARKLVLQRAEEVLHRTACDNERHQSTISTESSRMKRAREDTPMLFSFETPGKNSKMNVDQNMNYQQQEVKNDMKGMKRLVETEASVSTGGHGTVGPSGDKRPGSDDESNFGQASNPNLYPTSTKRVRRGDALQIAPHVTMVAARHKFQIKHHASLLAPQEGSSLGSGTFAIGVQSSSSTSTRRLATAGKGRVASPPHILPPTREDNAARPRSSLSSGQTTAVNKSTALAVIDGSNVAFAHRENLSNPLWSPHGILLCLEYFRDRDVDVIAFVPRPRVDGMDPSNEHKRAILEAVKNSEISLVPTKGNDDLFILSYAIQRNAYIVTNDQFRDHGRRAETLPLGLDKKQLEVYLSNYRVCYTFARDEFIPNPESSLIKVLTRPAVGES